MSSLAKVVNTAVKSMTPSLRNVFKEISELVGSLSENNFLYYHRIGHRVHDISEEAKEEKYGTAPVPRLAEALGVDERMLWFTVRFYNEYTVDELKKLAHKKTNSGRAAVLWTHMTQLLSVEDRTERDALVQLIVEKSLTTKELELAIRKRFGKRGAGGRPMVRPKTPFACLQQIEQISLKLLSRNNDVWADALTEIGRLPPDDYTSDFLKQLDAALDQQRQVVQVSQGNVQKLEQLDERVRSSIEKAKEGKKTKDEKEAKEEKKAK